MFIESVMLSKHLILCPPSSFAFNLSQNQVFFFPMSQLFETGGQSIGSLASPTVHPINTQGWFPSGLTGLILQSKELSKSFLQHHNLKASVLQCSVFFMVQLLNPYMTTGKTIALTIWTFVSKVVSLLFIMLSMFVIAFLPRSKCLLISWLQLPSTVILDLSEVVGGRRKSVIACTFSPSICPWSDATRFHELHLLNVKF